MPEKTNGTGAFEKVLKEIRDRGLSGAELDQYISNVKPDLDDESYRELLIALKLDGYAKLDREYDEWVGEAGAREASAISGWNIFFRYGWIAAAVLLVLNLLRPGMVPVMAGYSEITDSKEFTNALISEAESLGMDLRSAMEPNPLRRLKHVMEVKYCDIDEDDAIEVIIVNNGRMLVMNHDGTREWAFTLNPSHLEEDFINGGLKESVRFLHNNVDRFDPNDIYHAADYDVDSPGWLDAAWPQLLTSTNMVDILDFDHDGHLEILMSFRGALLVISHEGNLQNVIVDGVERKHIVLLDGDFFSDTKAIEDLDGDGEYELIVCKGCNDPLNSVDGAPVRIEGYPYIWGERPDRDDVIEPEPYNERGLFVADINGHELWHINLPYHVDRLSVCDFDNDGSIEIIPDTYTPNNFYRVIYDGEYENIAGNNFDWTTWPDDIQVLEDWTGVWEDKPGIPPGSGKTMFLAFGMNEEGGYLDHYEIVDTANRYTYVANRNFSDGDESTTVVFRYTDHPVEDEVYSYSLFDFNDSTGSLIPVITDSPGYPELRFNEGVYGLGGFLFTGFAIGISREGRLDIHDGRLGISDSYEISVGNGNLSVPWKSDVIVYDTGDLDGDGTVEILCGFGTLHAPWASSNVDSLMTVVKVFSVAGGIETGEPTLFPFKPEQNLDTIIAAGPVIDASFEDVDNQGPVDIVLVADYIYFLKPEF